MNVRGPLGRPAAAARSVTEASLRAVIRGLVGVLVLLLLVLAPLAPAGAHDAIEGAEPTDGSVLPAVPAAVKLTFNNPPLALGAVVQVVDQAGVSQSDGGVAITDNVVTQPLKAGAPAGRYTVVWRVVSSDSHPIEGRFAFTAGSALAKSSTASPVPASAPARDEPADAAVTLWTLALGVLVLAFGLVARSRLSRSGSS